MKYKCPVCGYDNLASPPRNSTICPSCLTEFDYNDVGNSYEELRTDWIVAGARWESGVIPQPPNWSYEKQLRNIGYHLTDSDRKAIKQARANSIGRVEMSRVGPLVILRGRSTIDGVFGADTSPLVLAVQRI